LNKKIVFLTGTRADFGKLKSLIDKIEDSRHFDSYIFATGMHTIKKYGNTYGEIKKYNYKNLTIFRNFTDETHDLVLAKTIKGFSNYVKKIKPDMIIIHGDRLEPLAGAIVGLFNNILVGHIEGGEISGTVDEIIRHSITKLSHIHFVSNNEAKKRVVQMGEDPNSVFIIGSPDIEVMKKEQLPGIHNVKNYYDIKFQKYSIFIFHPVVTEISDLRIQIKEVINAIIESNKNYIIIYPNNDKGSNIIIKEIERIKNRNNIKVFPTLRFKYFLSLLKNAEFILGNSSVIVREAEVFGTPAINIGSRQKNRTKNTDIINVSPSKKKILNAIKRVEGIRFTPKSFFNQRKSTSKLFYKTLLEKKIWGINLQKQFIDL
tara:strand:+ start:1097 stop:2218 length:1122 start_codon:yes stop_codon:yes gene_type:complete